MQKYYGILRILQINLKNKEGKRGEALKTFFYSVSIVYYFNYLKIIYFPHHFHDLYVQSLPTCIFLSIYKFTNIVGEKGNWVFFFFFLGMILIRSSVIKREAYATCHHSKVGARPLVIQLRTLAVTRETVKFEAGIFANPREHSKIYSRQMPKLHVAWLKPIEWDGWFNSRGILFKRNVREEDCLNFPCNSFFSLFSGLAYFSSKLKNEKKYCFLLVEKIRFRLPRLCDSDGAWWETELPCGEETKSQTAEKQGFPSLHQIMIIWRLIGIPFPLKVPLHKQTLKRVDKKNSWRIE